MVGEIETAIYELIVKFVERQSIVLDAMRDLRPDIIMRIEGKADSKQLSELKQKHARDAGHGYWGNDNEWKYRLHGIGCHLTHTVTDEIIGWDVSGLRRFDPQWFIHWVEWFIKHNSENELARVMKMAMKHNTISEAELRSLIYPVLDEFVKLGLIRPAKHRFVLLKK